MRKVILLRGTPNSGKTTLAYLLRDGYLSYRFKTIGLLIAKIKNILGFSYLVASDDFKDIYANGKYQSKLSGKAHDWCFSEFEKALEKGTSLVVVHNTFVERYRLQKYIDKAIQYGYGVQIVHAEGLILPNGEKPNNEHNVPEPVVNAMSYNWEPFNKVESPITRNVIADTLQKINANPYQRPLIVADMDGTVKVPSIGDPYPISPSDAVLKPEFLTGFKHLRNIYSPELKVISNQAGISYGKKKDEFLDAEIAFLFELLDADFPGLKTTVRCAISRTGNKFWEYSSVGSKDILSANAPTYKPDIGMSEGLTTSSDRVVWVVGDRDMADGGFCLNWEKTVDFDCIYYIPIELFPIACQLLK